MLVKDFKKEWLCYSNHVPNQSWWISSLKVLKLESVLFVCMDSSIDLHEGALCCKVPVLHLEIKWKCVAGDICCFPASRCIRPIGLSVRLTCYQAAEITTQACYSHTNYELSLRSYSEQAASYLFHLLPIPCCKSASSPLPARPFPFCLTLHFAPVSLGTCSCLSSVPVRWNIGALLMIQQSFLYLSIHLFLLVKLRYRVVSRQGWFPFNSEAEGELCSLTASHPHLLHSLPVLL